MGARMGSLAGREVSPKPSTSDFNHVSDVRPAQGWREQESSPGKESRFGCPAGEDLGTVRKQKGFSVDKRWDSRESRGEVERGVSGPHAAQAGKTFLGLSREAA